MAALPNIGDVLMLSQLAWRIGCAFTSGRHGAPAEFQEVENELNGLTSALTLLAETLDEDGSIISRADRKTKDGVEKILESCRQTLSNLDSFVLHYQEIKKSDGDANGRIATQRSWKKILVRNYKTIWWTAEGGNIESLRSMLNMHVNSISLTMQALQSKSMSRLESTIQPMANKVDDIHDTINGDFQVKIDEIHHLMLSMAAMESSQTSPEIAAKRMSAGQRQIQLSGEEIKPVNFNPTPELPNVSTYSYPSNALDNDSQIPEPLTPSRKLKIGNGSRVRTESWSQRPDSWLVPVETRQESYPDDPLPEYQRYRTSPRTPTSNRNSFPSSAVESPAVSRAESEAARKSSQGTLNMLPQPVIPIEEGEELDSRTDYEKLLSPDAELCPAMQMKVTASDAELAAFEKDLFTNSAVLCEAKCSKVEYTAIDEANPRELRMVQGSTECRLFLVTKRYKLKSGILRFTTSIWALSDDKVVRMQQELPDGEEVIPYTVWKNLKKICIRIPTELRFYDTLYDAKTIDTAKTSWVNYVLENDRTSSLFQSALMGKTLIMSLETNKTMRVHEGIIADTFSYQEQMCALENLRIWQDHETNSFTAMIHYTAHFRDGYLAFYLNSARDPIRVRDEGGKVVKVKGLRVEAPPKSSRSRTGSLDHHPKKSPNMKPKDKASHQIRGAKIEFSNEADKRAFLDKVREVQGTFFPG